MGISRNALASGSRQKREPGANARRLMVQSRWHWALALVVLHIFMLPLPSGLSRRERQLAGYTRTLGNTFPEHSWLSVGPVPAGARLAG